MRKPSATCISPTDTASSIHLLPPSRRTDASLLKTGRGLPRDAQGDVRRGRPPKVPPAETTRAEVRGTHRAGGSSSSSIVPKAQPPSVSATRAAIVDERTTVEVRRRLRAKMADTRMVERTKSTLHIALPVDMGVDAPTPEEMTPQKRTTLDSIESDDDEPAVKYWRSDDFVWTSWIVVG